MGEPKSPQDKKRLSYERDRRNVYGENDKSSRKNIPRHKARTHRAHRSNVRTAIASSDAAAPDALEARVRSLRRKPWSKSPDKPLGSVVKQKLAKRKQREGAKKARASARRP